MHPPAQATRRAQVVEALADAVPAVDHAPPIHVAVDGLDDPATRALADDLDRQAVRPGPPLPAGDPGRPQPPPPGRPRGGTTRPPCRAGRRPGGGGRLLPPAPGVPWRMGSGRVPALGPSGAPRPVRGPRPGHGRRPVPHPGRPRGHRRGRGRPARPRLAGDPPHEPAAGRPPRPRGVPGRDPAFFAPGGHVGTALPRRRPGLRAAVAEVGLHPGQTALDAGCGTGRALPHLRAAVGPAGRVLGLDLTPEMLAPPAPTVATPTPCSPWPPATTGVHATTARPVPHNRRANLPVTLPRCHAVDVGLAELRRPDRAQGRRHALDLEFLRQDGCWRPPPRSQSASSSLVRQDAERLTRFGRGPPSSGRGRGRAVRGAAGGLSARRGSLRAWTCAKCSRWSPAPPRTSAGRPPTARRRRRRRQGGAGGGDEPFSAIGPW